MTVKFSGPIKKYTAGESDFTPVTSTTLRELLNELNIKFGEDFKNFITDNESCLILINGKGTMMFGGLDTPLKSNDLIEILPVVIAG